MEKMFNFISVIGGLVGGFIVSLFGGWDVMLYTILLFAILDYFTGILKAVYKKELSSAIGFKGIVKKIMVFVVIAVAYNVQLLLFSLSAMKHFPFWKMRRNLSTYRSS